MLKELGWEGLVKSQPQAKDLSELHITHLAQHLFRHYKHHGTPEKIHTHAWTKLRIKQAMNCVAHRSCIDNMDFLESNFLEMINKNQWIVLSYPQIQDISSLQISPPEVIPQREYNPRWICDYLQYNVNQEKIDLFAAEPIQYGHALDCILREILLANPSFGPVYVHKIDISDAYYRMDVTIQDIPNLGVIFPSLPGHEPLVAFPLVLPIGWKNSAPESNL